MITVINENLRPATAKKAENADATEKMGEDLVLKVPEGTVIKEANTAERLLRICPVRTVGRLF